MASRSSNDLNDRLCPFYNPSARIVQKTQVSYCCVNCGNMFTQSLHSNGYTRHISCRDNCSFVACGHYLTTAVSLAPQFLLWAYTPRYILLIGFINFQLKKGITWRTSNMINNNLNDLNVNSLPILVTCSTTATSEARTENQTKKTNRARYTLKTENTLIRTRNTITVYNVKPKSLGSRSSHCDWKLRSSEMRWRFQCSWRIRQEGKANLT
jgi:DNA-directed RNA polymerase subunit RPC12/RpoP